MLSNVDKIIEKRTQKRVIQFLDGHNILYQKQQFGFQKNFSTVHQIIKLIEDIEKSFENKKSVCTVFIDLKKAFDTVDQNVMKLNNFLIME